MKKSVFLPFFLLALLSLSITLATTSTTQPSGPGIPCTDSDGGIKYYDRGYTTFCTYTEQGSKCDTLYDFCTNNVLTEFYCEGSERKSVEYECPNHDCDDGKCGKFGCSYNKPCNSGLICHKVWWICRDCPDYGECLTDPGDYCIGKEDNTQVNDEYDLYSIYISNITGSKLLSSCGWNYRCCNQECVYTGDNLCPSSQNCTDSDGGLDYETYGFTIVHQVTMGTRKYTDFCLGDNVLVETFCEGNLYKSIEYACPNGCIDGVCKKTSGNDETTGVVCEDSDNGDIYTSGVVIHGDGTLKAYDRCDSETKLKEVNCDNGYYIYKGYLCPNGCKDGACINISTTSSTTTITTVKPTTQKGACSLDGDPCRIDDQCCYGYCCDGVCSSSECKEIKPNIFVRIYQGILNFFRTLLEK